ncbi:hypothetical protein U0X36_05655 [Bacillus thuringiensis]|uniref:hypothetical protein n=1 Tax=Bacillus thuringiensis TaxID=1428 RepID=UPI0015F321F9|nr:hypothetical protein [Bacillus thuringiensis]MDZ3952427.1 hypothetical protein [Bacillus thuringiensis]
MHIENNTNRAKQKGYLIMKEGEQKDAKTEYKNKRQEKLEDREQSLRWNNFDG